MEAMTLRRWWCLTLFPLLLLHNQVGAEACAPSRCGKITNITHPFRLRDDPPECGDRRFELSCENNVTQLHLFSGGYNVLGINYNKQTIRIVDAGIREGDCSTLPSYSLYLYNFSHPHDWSADGDPYRIASMFEHIIYLNCSNPVGRDDDHLKYVDTNPCVNWESKGHFHAILGDFGVGNLTDRCQVKLVATITKNWGSFLHNKNYSYADIHRLLSYGFDLSWSPGVCSGLCPLGLGPCIINYDAEKRRCSVAVYPGSKLIVFVSDFVEGTFNGLRQIKGDKIKTNYSDSEFYQWEPFVRAMGLVTGRFILPYHTLRFLLGITLLFVWLIYKCSRRHLSMDENIENYLQYNDLMPIRYSYKEIKKMMRGFKDKLGEGGFGTAYKGKLCSGSLAAIKILGKSKANGQEFINEVAIIGRIRHVHIVQLIGFCVKGSHGALVYEFMPNGSLDKYIFSEEISDFGLAKLYPVDDSIVALTAAKETIGYMAPELFYKNIGGVSSKADVYSFRMLLMEMASRRRNTNPRNIEHSSQLYFPLWLYDQFIEEKDIGMEDLTEEEKNLVKKMLIVSWWCIQLNPADRPSMNKVIEMLEVDAESLEMPPKPLLYPNEIVTENHEFSSNQSSSHDFIDSASYASYDMPENMTSSGGKIIPK